MTDASVYCTLVILIVLLFFLSIQPGELRPKARRQPDFSGAQEARYDADLEQRLRRFRQKTGYAIKIVKIAEERDQNLGAIASEQFNLQQVYRGSNGTIFVLVNRTDGRVAIKTSDNLRSRFSQPEIEAKITRILRGESSESVMTERVVHAILERLNFWFYVLDPPTSLFLFVRLPTAEMILLVFAPFFGLITGISSIAFTPLGNLRWWGRFAACGCLAFCVVAVFAFAVRQPGGIYPGIFFYALGIGFAVSGIVGALKQFWIDETFRGRKPDGWWNGPVHFRYG